MWRCRAEAEEVRASPFRGICFKRSQRQLQGFREQDRTANLPERLDILGLGWLELRQLLENLDLRLSLRRTVGVIPPPVDICLEMLPVCELGVVLLLLRAGALCLGRIELREVTLEVVEPFRVLPDDVGRDGVEE